MSTSASPAMPVFSYAQAAKGLAPAKEEATEQNSKPASKPDQTPSQPSSRPPRSRARAEDKENENIAKETSTPASTVEDSAEKENIPPSRPSQQRSEATTSSATSPNLTGAMGSPKEKDLTQRLDHSDSWEKASHTSLSGDKELPPGQRDKVKESEDDWEKVSVPSVGGEKEKELKPAPPPPVNFWTARQQAQEAKMRETSNLRAVATPHSAPPTAGPKPKSFMEASKNKSSSRDPFDKDGLVPSRRSNDSGRGNERADMTSSQTSKPEPHLTDKGDSASVPTVGDVSSWPTPENANIDDRRKSLTHDKTESRPNGSKSHGKQWVTMPFVPTAKFETQLPASAARRGARSGRGRDGLSRGAHSGVGNSAEKNESANAMPPPPVPRHTGEQDRGRKSDGSRGGRSSSLPTGNRRAPSRESTMAGQRKTFGAGRDNSAVQGSAATFSPADTSPANNQRVSNFESHSPSRSSSRHEGTGTMAAADTDITTSQTAAESATDPFTLPNTEVAGRPSYLSDRGKQPHSTYRPPGEVVRERGPTRNRDWSREKSDAAREKVESWRDREYAGEPNFRREPRSERGGRGSYRGGRGNHSSSYQGSHAYTSPLPQNGFENPKASNAPEPRPRQSSQIFPMSSQISSSRNNPRSQSIPVTMMYPGYYNNVQGMPQALSPIQTEMPAYGYPTQMPMQPGIVSAMPYNDPLSSYAVLSMVMTQIEYYFSIDNLCKDLYLRKNMDSQGWVPLSVIANFKRIKTLTEDSMSMDTLRYVCQQVKSVEYLHGDDGEDRLRRREGWEDFVLEKQERFPAAQIDGPPIQTRVQQMPMIPPMLPADSMPFVPNPVRSPQSAMPAMSDTFQAASLAPYASMPSLDGQAGDPNFQMPFSHENQDQTRLEQATSPISQEEHGARHSMPIIPNYRPTGGMVNGHRRQTSRNFNEENTFPDDAIASINICVREPLPEVVSDEQTSMMPVMTRILSNESHGSNADVPSVSNPPRVTGLRGGAASPEQLARLQGMKFGFSSSQTPPALEDPAFYTKEGEQTQMPPVKPGQYFVSYHALHDSSLQQREQGVEGAMKPMYSFWSNFLVDKFNTGMYGEFKSLAESDAQEGDAIGIQHLMNYYHGALKSTAALSERVAVDLVALLREEKDQTRPIFKMMRIAWRDGALNLKTRKRVGDLLSDEEKAEFDKGG